MRRRLFGHLHPYYRHVYIHVFMLLITRPKFTSTTIHDHARVLKSPCVVIVISMLIGKFFHLQSVSVLSLVPRRVCRNISADIYNQRVSDANNLLRQNCVHLKITYWKLRGFTTSQKNIYCDGVNFNCLGLYKLMRQIRGLFLTRPQDSY